MEVLSSDAADASSSHFAVALLAHGWTGESKDVLVNVIENDLQPMNVRREALATIESFAGGDFNLNPDSYRVDYSATFEVRAANASRQLSRIPLVIDGKEVVLAGECIRSALRSMLAKRTQRDDFPLHVYESDLNAIQLYVGLLSGTSHSQLAAPLLMEHLRELRNLPKSNQADSFDRVVGQLEFQALAAIQNHIGPIGHLDRDLHDRAGVEVIVDEIFAWWKEAQSRSPIEWNMDRLQLAGYKTGKKEQADVVATELIRAVQCGNGAECMSASTSLLLLGISDGLVPCFTNETALAKNADIRLVNAQLRTHVVLEATRNMLDGRLPHWSPASEEWVSSKVSSKLMNKSP